MKPLPKILDKAWIKVNQTPPPKDIYKKDKKLTQKQIIRGIYGN